MILVVSIHVHEIPGSVNTPIMMSRWSVSGV
jgi:hypothetical protein